MNISPLLQNRNISLHKYELYRIWFDILLTDMQLMNILSHYDQIDT